MNKFNGTLRGDLKRLNIVCQRFHKVMVKSFGHLITSMMYGSFLISFVELSVKLVSSFLEG